MNKEVQNAISELMKLFEGSFINHNYELILIPSSNMYFCLGNIETVLDIKCKVIAWCSRHACKTMAYHTNWRNEKYQVVVREKINKYLGVDFSTEDWMFVYTYLGNDIRRELCEKFINSGYDLKIIKEAISNE